MASLRARDRQRTIASRLAVLLAGDPSGGADAAMRRWLPTYGRSGHSRSGWSSGRQRSRVPSGQTRWSCIWRMASGLASAQSPADRQDRHRPDLAALIAQHVHHIRLAFGAREWPHVDRSAVRAWRFRWIERATSGASHGYRPGVDPPLRTAERAYTNSPYLVTVIAVPSREHSASDRRPGRYAM